MKRILALFVSLALVLAPLSGSRAAGSIYDYTANPASNTSAPPAGFAVGQAPSTVAPTFRALMGYLTEFVHSNAAGGTPDAITLTLTNVPASLTDGMEVHVRAAAANATATPTLALNPVLVTTGNTHTNTTVDGLASTAGILVGMNVSGAGIQVGATVSSITGSSIVISLAATATASGVSLTFGYSYPITKQGGAALTPGDIPGNLAEFTVRYNLANTRWELVNPGTASQGIGIATSLASGTTTDLGTISSHNVSITGTGAPVVATGNLNSNTTINSLSTTTGINVGMAVQGIGLAAGTFVTVVGSGQVTVNQNALSTSSAVTLTFGGNIASFGSSANTGAPLYLVKFGGALTLTYNATSMQLLGSNNIVTAAGDSALMEYLGSGNWAMRAYFQADGAALNAGNWTYGDGSDGNVTCTSGSTLSRDMFYANLTVQSGCAIVTAYRIYVAGTLDLSSAPAGSFVLNGSAGTAGNAGTSAAGGTGGTGGTSGASGSVGNGGTGATGGAGSTTTGSAGANKSTTAANGGSTPAAGSGGTTTAHAAAATSSASVLVPQGTQWPNSPFGLALGSNQSLFPPNGGAGGSSGAGGNGNGTNGGGGGGGGGGGAGVIVIAAQTIYRGANTTTGIIQLKGGTGATGGAGYSAGTSAGGGGGCGGGGGWLVLAYGNLTGKQITGAIDVSGGAGGTGGAGFGTGSTGGQGGCSGGSGVEHAYNLGAQTLTVTQSVAGSTGSAASGLPGGAGAPATSTQLSL